MSENEILTKPVPQNEIAALAESAVALHADNRAAIGHIMQTTNGRANPVDVARAVAAARAESVREHIAARPASMTLDPMSVQQRMLEKHPDPDVIERIGSDGDPSFSRPIVGPLLSARLKERAVKRKAQKPPRRRR